MIIFLNCDNKTVKVVHSGGLLLLLFFGRPRKEKKPARKQKKGY